MNIICEIKNNSSLNNQQLKQTVHLNILTRIAKRKFRIAC